MLDIIVDLAMFAVGLGVGILVGIIIAECWNK